MQAWDEGRLVGGRYRIIGTLGRGGMGVVYAAEDTRLQGKLRAMKVTALAEDAAEEMAAQQPVEAWMLMRLSHPNLPLIVDYYPREESGCEIVVMDFIHGETAAARMERMNNQMGFHEVITIALQLCSALAYLHGQTPRIIHRDLKPSNVMLEENGNVRLIDLGIAREFKSGQRTDTMRLGTPGFAAPEQESGEQSDERTDIYGLGALLYYMLSGGKRYPSPLLQRTSSDPMRLLQQRDDVPRTFVDTLSRMLQARPERRHGSIAEVEQALLSYSLGKHSPAASSAHGHPRTSAQASPSMLINVLALSPGAGATFLTLTLAHLLGLRGYPCSAAEYPSPSSEWVPLLQPAPSASRVSADGLYRSWHRHGVWWNGLQPRTNGTTQDEQEKLKLMLGQQPSLFTLMDLSSQWETAGASAWIRRSSYLIIVADPHPAKWQAHRLIALQKLSGEAEQLGARILWVVNKDASFRHRREWLEMLPMRPAAAIPQLPQEEWLNLVWDGKWATDHPRLRKVLERAMTPLTDVLLREMHTRSERI
ncbi:serine/threonine protein kinase [Paenibacillus sp. GCM10023252]|uniref:serine/threonine protein kinase n=1 Tax=Paenibacillus sp. GCM10023252 TaxID=3252649 RepID=UPI0036182B12